LKEKCAGVGSSNERPQELQARPRRKRSSRPVAKSRTRRVPSPTEKAPSIDAASSASASLRRCRPTTSLTTESAPAGGGVPASKETTLPSAATARKSPERTQSGACLARSSAGRGARTRTRTPSPSWARSAAATLCGDSRLTTAAHAGQTTVPVEAKRRRRTSWISVAVPTVERAERAGAFCSMARAGRRWSILSTSGRSIRSRNCRA
jgi:hypothetical protein